jgi:hypothetical protein
VLLNSADPARSESTLKDVQAAANTLALQVQVLNASIRGRHEKIGYEPKAPGMGLSR